MSKYNFNDSINKFEIDPRYLEEGIQVAENERFESIRIRGFVDDTDFNCQLDLTPLENKTFIKSITINDSFKLKKPVNIEAIYTLLNLTELRVELPIPLDFSRLTQLEKLYLNNSSYENLEKLVNLRELYFFGYSKQNCYEFHNLRELIYLRLSGSSKLSTLDGIEVLKNLKTCWLAKNSQLVDANGLSHLNSLEWLHVESCKKLMNYSFLNENNSIKKLLISDLDSLEFVKTMKKLEEINFWFCNNGDLSPLLECSRLREVSFHPEKKHYSHKRDTINSILKSKA